MSKLQIVDFILFHVLFLFSIFFFFLSYFRLRVRVWYDVTVTNWSQVTLSQWKIVEGSKRNDITQHI